MFPVIIIGNPNQQITTIPIDQIETRTAEIENLIKEYQQQQNRVLREIELTEERNDFFNQLEQQQVNASDEVEVETKKENKKQKKMKQVLCGGNSSLVEVETKKENKKEKNVKQVATKKTKKETKPKTTKATKKKEETKNYSKEKKTKK